MFCRQLQLRCWVSVGGKSYGVIEPREIFKKLVSEVLALKFVIREKVLDS